MVEPRTDRVTDRVERAIREGYAPHHPRAEVMAYREDGWSILVRVIDPDFEGLDFVDREKPFLPILATFSDAVHKRIMMLLTLTPAESRESVTSAEFDAVMKVLKEPVAKKPARNGTARPGRK